MMSSYLKIQKLVADEDSGSVEDMEGESVRVSEWKKKKSSIGEGSNSGGKSISVFCVVQNCEADLNVCKKYHKRHRVCEVHAKAPVALVHGLRQRFCQQCSRFHEVSEFDQAKRSCRRRLAGHNERRRKSSLESRIKDQKQCMEIEGTVAIGSGGGLNYHIH